MSLDVRPLKITAIIAGLLLVAGGGAWFLRDRITPWFFRPTTSSIREGVREIDARQDIQTVAEKLQVPWEVAFVPGTIDVLVTQRPGILTRVGANGFSQTISGVEETSEGGLLGMALHPKFVQNHWIYLYYTTNQDGKLANTVARYTLQGDTVRDKKTILANIPASANHDGGRLAFAPDGYLYVATGDAGDADAAQDTASLAGKILRITDEGAIPDDNPFQNAVYSYGHRNVQGIAWDDKKRLWATEHGRSGEKTGYDELNRIQKGKNYGWPIIQGDEKRAGMVSPVAQSGATEAWAPASLAFADGSLYFAGLRGEALYQAKIINENTVELTAHLKGDYGRLRTVTHHDDMLYVTTSNTDGRGDPGKTDDRILRFTVDTLTK